MFKRLTVAVLGLAVVLSFWAPAVWAQVDYIGTNTVILSGGGAASVPPAGAITSAQAVAAVTKYFTPPKGASVNADYSAGFLPQKRQIWNINWMVLSPAPSGGPPEGMWASVDAMTGRILNFNRQSPAGTSGQGSSGVSYSYREALARARQTMAELAPEAVGHVKLEATPGFYGFSGKYGYQFDFLRLESGLPVWEAGQPQGVDIGVNARTGEVDNYSFNWLSGVDFPAPNASLDVTKATYAWWNTGGLELHYFYVPPVSPVSGSPNQVRLVYELKDGELFVDARTGGIIDSSGQPYRAAAGEAVPAPTVPLATPPAGGLTSSAAALSWAGKVLPIPAGYKTAGVDQGQMTDLTGQTRQQWNLSWSQGQEGQGPGISATFLAADGQLVEYNVMTGPAGMPGTAGESKPAVSWPQALQKAVDFLTAAGIKLSGGYRLENQPAYFYADNQDSYMVAFTPVPNGIPFDMGGLYVRLSSVTGQVLDFNESGIYPPVNLPSPQGVMGLDRAGDIFNKNVRLQLGYLIPGDSGSQGSAPPAPVLVYGVPARFAGALIDAVTGEMTDPEGTNLLLGSGPPADVAGSWAAGNIGLVLQGRLMSVDARGLFHPNDPVTRGQAVAMLIQSLYGDQLQAFPSGPADFSDVPAGSPYYKAVETACKLGVVARAARFRPNDPVTRQDFAVMAVRALKYDAIGRMAVSIPLPFKDAGLVNPAEANYVALAAGLGIFNSGGDFRPSDPLTRAEAATVLVRLPSPR